MNKAIFIGELALNITLPERGSLTATTSIGDRAVNAAMLLGKMGVETVYMGEVAADSVGEHIIGTLADCGVDTSSIDRFSEGASPVKISSPATDTGAGGNPVIHASYPAEPVDPCWPRIDEGDVLAYGSFMALDKRNHDRLLEIVGYAASRKAETVYLPYFDLTQVPRTTRVMPEIWDCLEKASMVIASVDDLDTIFPGEEPAKAYHDHILFYCPRCLVTDYANLKMHFYDHESSWTLDCHPTTLDSFHWTSGALAGAMRALVEGMRDPDEIMRRANETAHSLLASE